MIDVDTWILVPAWLLCGILTILYVGLAMDNGTLPDLAAEAAERESEDFSVWRFVLTFGMTIAFWPVVLVAVLALEAYTRATRRSGP